MKKTRHQPYPSRKEERKLKVSLEKARDDKDTRKLDIELSIMWRRQMGRGNG